MNTETEVTTAHEPVRIAIPDTDIVLEFTPEEYAKVVGAMITRDLHCGWVGSPFAFAFTDTSQGYRVLARPCGFEYRLHRMREIEKIRRHFNH